MYMHMDTTENQAHIEKFLTCIKVLCYHDEVFPAKPKNREVNQQTDNVADKCDDDYNALVKGNLKVRDFLTPTEKTDLLLNGLNKTLVEYNENNPYWSPSIKEENLLCLEIKQDVVIRDLWISLCQSLLSGEYLFDAEYSEKLNLALELIRNLDEEYYASCRHPVLTSVYKICLRIREICELTRLQITEYQHKEESRPKGKRSVYCWHGEDNIVREGDKFGREGEHYAEQFESFMVLMVKMTHIDISGTMRRTDIQDLQKLYDYCAPMEARGGVPLLPPHEFSASVIRAIKAKTSLLITQSFYKPCSMIGVKPESLFNNEDVYHSTKSTLFLHKGRRYFHNSDDFPLYELLTTKSKYHNELYLGDFRDLIRVLGINFRWNMEGEDISNYIQYINKGRELESQGKGVLNTTLNLQEYTNLTENLKKTKLEIDNILAKEDKETSDLNKLDEQCKKYIKQVNHLREALENIALYIRQYSSYIPVGVRTRGVWECLFVIDNQVEVFIASYGTKPILIDVLEDEVYPSLNLKYKEFSVNLQYVVYQVFMKETRHSKDVSLRVEEQQKRQEKQEKSLKAYQEWQKKQEESLKAHQKWQEKQEESLKKQEAQYISILGIFAAIIVFVMTTTTIFKEANTLLEFLSVLCAGFGLTALFLFFFKKPENEGGCVLIGTIFFALIFSAVFAFCDAGHSQKESEVTENKADGGINANFSVSYQPGAMEQVPNKADSNARSTVDTVRQTAN